jgi:hypothetical protein
VTAVTGLLTERTCPCCKVTKPASGFYPDKRNKYGLCCYCKECQRAKTLLYRNANLDKARAASRDWHAKHPAETAENLKKTKARAPWKQNARVKVHRAIRAGTLVPRPCEVCGSPKAQAHHDDYSKPLDVRWLCHLHHMERHRKYPHIDRVAS